jgi:hypothetical protein
LPFANKKDIEIAMVRIPLTQGKFAIVDPEDVALVSQFRWHASFGSRQTKYYAVRKVHVGNRKYKNIRMHRLIMGLGTQDEDPRVVDHINHNSLDNRRSNLEIITQEENMRRSPGWKKKPWL